MWLGAWNSEKERERDTHTHTHSHSNKLEHERLSLKSIDRCVFGYEKLLLCSQVFVIAQHFISTLTCLCGRAACVSSSDKDSHKEAHILERYPLLPQAFPFCTS
jgi:hypothetical protein